jgi:hypothetical protein
LYVIDFYNQAVVHNDTRGPKHGAHNAAVRPDRDHHMGRIWRVQHKDAKQLPPANLTSGNHKDWVAALNHPNGAIRMNAQRLIEDNNAADTAPDLQQLVQKGSSYGRINALWLLNNLGKLDDATLSAALAADDAGLRKNGFRLIAENDARASDANKAAVLKAAKRCGCARENERAARSRLVPGQRRYRQRHCRGLPEARRQIFGIGRGRGRFERSGAVSRGQLPRQRSSDARQLRSARGAIDRQ